jgi:hypothetical protein
MSSQRGSGAPVRENRRMKFAMEQIHLGTLTFTLTGLHGLHGISSPGARLIMTHDDMCIESHGVPVWECTWGDVKDYEVVDEIHSGASQNGVKFVISTTKGEFTELMCECQEVRLLKFSVEFFFNSEAERRSSPTKPQSTHGRRVRKLHTLTGDIDPPPPPKGSLEITDVDGTVVRPATAGNVSAMTSISSSSVHRQTTSPATSTSTAKIFDYARYKTSFGKIVDFARPVKGFALEDPRASAHWSNVCLHQGWLLKRGGISWGWQRRYAVLWRTAQVF